MNEWL